MAKKFHQDLFDNGLNTLITAAATGTLKLCLVTASPANFAAITTSKVITPIPLSGADVTLESDGSTPAGRQITIASKTAVATAAAGAGADLHVVIYDTDTSKIYVQTTEATNQAIVIGANLLFPALVFGFSAPI